MAAADAELVARAARGDPDAVHHLLCEVRPIAVRYCRAHLGRAGGAYTTADDLAQEVCVAVLRALPGRKPSDRPFLAFVYGIAAHKVADAGRAARRAELLMPTDALPDSQDAAANPEGRALLAELSERLGQLLARLPVTQREVVILRVAVGMTAEDVGAVLRMTPGAVRLSQHRALLKLRSLAAETLDGVAR